MTVSYLNLTASPSFCRLLLASAGMDPNARRFVWDRVNDEMRKGRSIVLTSHSMQECQALCSRIGIMVNGHLQCLGSPQHLKTKYGDGYTLILKVASADVEAAKAFVARSFAGARLEEEHCGYLHFMLPIATMPPLSEAFGMFEGSKVTLGLEDYQISQTSLDEIFCKFALIQDGEAPPLAVVRAAGESPGTELDAKSTPNPIYHRVSETTTVATATAATAATSDAVKTQPSGSAQEGERDRVTDPRGSVFLHRDGIGSEPGWLESVV